MSNYKPHNYNKKALLTQRQMRNSDACLKAK